MLLEVVYKESFISALESAKLLEDWKDLESSSIDSFGLQLTVDN